MRHGLEGKTAVVLGVGTELGAACARRFAEEGAEVIAVERDAARAAGVARSIDADGTRVVGLGLDPGSEQDATALAAACTDRWGRLDVFVHCSGAMDTGGGQQTTMAEWELIVRLNLVGPAVYVAAMRPLLTASGDGSIVLFSSLDGIRGNPHFPAFSASKAGLIPLTHVLAHDLAPQGVRVNCFATALISQVGPGEPQPPNLPRAGTPAIIAATPLRRPPRPEEIASVALFFASSESSYVTGSVLRVDGGRMTITPGTA
jgi:NAD(P)-dependent dehydrogenase (short-subunit alcohol dehydrogenase family)